MKPENHEQVFSYYKNIFNVKETKRIALQEIYQLICGSTLKPATLQIRYMDCQGSSDDAKQLKLQLPAIAVSAIFNEQRKTEQAIEHTGLIMVDVDGMQTSAYEYLQRSKKLPWLCMAYISARGKGVHLFFKVEKNLTHHEQVCRALYDVVEMMLGEPVDRNCTDITRTSLLCWDENCYFNPQASVFKWQPPMPQMAGLPLTESERLQLYLDQVDLSTAWLKGQRHAQLVSLAFCLNRAGFSRETVQNECVRRYSQPDFDAKEITKTIASIYARAQAEHGANQRETGSAYYKKYATSATSATKDYKTEEEMKEEDETPVEQPLVPPLPRVDYSILEKGPQLFLDMIRPGLVGFQKDIATVGALTMISSAMPHVEGRYHREMVSPTLFLYVVAQSGSGKGVLNGMRSMLEPWQNQVRNNSRSYVLKYEEEMHNYLLAETKSIKTGKPLMLSKPTLVEQMELNIAGTITQAKLIQQLRANADYPSLMHESEIGVLVEAIHNDHGKYTYVLNQIAHQEEIQRASVANSTIICKRPQMAMLTSGTFGQFSQLIRTADDGLFSRILAYTTNEPPAWLPLTNEDDDPNAGNHYNEVGERIRQAAEFLYENKTFVHYTDAQRHRLNTMFKKMAEQALLFGNEDRANIVFRLGRTHFCICQILTALRKVEMKSTVEMHSVHTEDEAIATMFIKMFQQHMLSLGTMLKGAPGYSPASDPNIYEKFFNELPEYFRTAQAKEAGLAKDIPERTIDRHLSKWVHSELIIRLSAGKYKKVKMKYSD